MNPQQAQAAALELYDAINPNQKRTEYGWAARRIVELIGRPGCVLEVGSERGGTLALWSTIALDAAELVAVDLPPPGASHEPDIRAAIRRPEQKLTLIVSDSGLSETKAAVDTALAGRHPDFCFIDADHGEVAVRRDFAIYAPLVRENGVVVFHDIVPHDSARNIEVWKFWNELRERFYAQTDQCVESPGQVCMGIGILLMSSEVRSALGFV